MKYRKITAIISTFELEHLEKKLVEIGIPGMTVSKVQGMGEYKNFYNKDSMNEYTRVEIFSLAERADEIKDAIAHSVGKGLSTDGIIAILPVEELIHIKEYNESQA